MFGCVAPERPPSSYLCDGMFNLQVWLWVCGSRCFLVDCEDFGLRCVDLRCDVFVMYEIRGARYENFEGSCRSE